MYWNEKPYHSLDYKMKRIYGHKIYKLALDLRHDLSEPRRHPGYGRLYLLQRRRLRRICRILSAHVSVTEQIEAAKARVEKKWKSPARSITGISRRPLHCLFPVYTNTYARRLRIRALFTEAITHPDIAVRPLPHARLPSA